MDSAADNHFMAENFVEKNLTERMQGEISEKLQDAFESVIKSKNEHYQKNPQDIPRIEHIAALIQSSAIKNAAISGGASLIPGPWGMLAVVPELVLVTRSQIELIYDIAAAHGKKEMITPELLLGVFISAIGTGAGTVLVMHGSKYLVRRASLQVMQRLIALLGGKITQQAIKSAVSKWFPGIGAVAMAAWTNYLTKQIGKKANEIMRHEIVNDPDTVDIELIRTIEVKATTASEIEAEPQALEYYKLQVLIGLIRIDGEISPEEEAYITQALEHPELTAHQRLRLTAQLAGEPRALEGIEALAASPDNAIALLSSMTALAKQDNTFHITEKLFIKQIGKLLGFTEEDVGEVVASI
jgi:uncharacterized protein (DUF697 family)